ncbi:hypothetical protein QG37_08276 [Candidozyma auris]|nr:hypothetical protein QG37_08276 [[Candida] auris]
MRQQLYGFGSRSAAPQWSPNEPSQANEKMSSGDNTRDTNNHIVIYRSMIAGEQKNGPKGGGSVISVNSGWPDLEPLHGGRPRGYRAMIPG